MTNCVILAEISHHGILSLAFDVCVFISRCECVTSGACLFVFSLHTLARQSRAEPDPGQLSQLHFQRENVCVW